MILKIPFSILEQRAKSRPEGYIQDLYHCKQDGTNEKILVIDDQSECWKSAYAKYQPNTEVKLTPCSDCAAKQQPKPQEWNTSMPSRGVGDTIARITHATGIAQAVEKISNATGKPCGCKKRQETLNKLFPYGGNAQPDANAN